MSAVRRCDEALLGVLEKAQMIKAYIDSASTTLNEYTQRLAMPMCLFCAGYTKPKANTPVSSFIFGSLSVESQNNCELAGMQQDVTSTLERWCFRKQ